ncbi:unnamed protein product [Amoebophrya sp. A25]|nr:unnamed protein product [Amoebophrya sp. A25]|eukprot:GSA25T00004845001.1
MAAIMARANAPGSTLPSAFGPTAGSPPAWDVTGLTYLGEADDAFSFTTSTTTTTTINPGDVIYPRDIFIEMTLPSGAGNVSAEDVYLSPEFLGVVAEGIYAFISNATGNNATLLSQILIVGMHPHIVSTSGPAFGDTSSGNGTSTVQVAVKVDFQVPSGDPAIIALLTRNLFPSGGTLGMTPASAQNLMDSILEKLEEHVGTTNSTNSAIPANAVPESIRPAPLTPTTTTTPGGTQYFDSGGGSGGGGTTIVRQGTFDLSVPFASLQNSLNMTVDEFFDALVSNPEFRAILADTFSDLITLKLGAALAADVSVTNVAANLLNSILESIASADANGNVTMATATIGYTVEMWVPDDSPALAALTDATTGLFPDTSSGGSGVPQSILDLLKTLLEQNLKEQAETPGSSLPGAGSGDHDGVLGQITVPEFGPIVTPPTTTTSTTTTTGAPYLLQRIEVTLHLPASLDEQNLIENPEFLQALMTGVRDYIADVTDAATAATVFITDLEAEIVKIGNTKTPAGGDSSTSIKEVTVGILVTFEIPTADSHTISQLTDVAFPSNSTAATTEALKDAVSQALGEAAAYPGSSLPKSSGTHMTQIVDGEGVLVPVSPGTALIIVGEVILVGPMVGPIGGGAGDENTGGGGDQDNSTRTGNDTSSGNGASSGNETSSGDTVEEDEDEEVKENRGDVDDEEDVNVGYSVSDNVTFEGRQEEEFEIDMGGLEDVPFAMQAIEFAKNFAAGSICGALVAFALLEGT